MKKNKSYTKEFKREVLEMATSAKVSVAQLERDLDITPGLIYKWRERYRVDEVDGEVKPSPEREAAAEIRRLKRELSVVKQERDILKNECTNKLWGSVKNLTLLAKSYEMHSDGNKG